MVDELPLAPGLSIPYFDQIAYGTGPDDCVEDRTEDAAITRGAVSVRGKRISYTATAGHLVTVNDITSQPAAKIFYVAYTSNDSGSTARPVTFFTNGGPGCSAVYLLLGSFGPRLVKTRMPAFAEPAPYTVEDNPDCLLDCSDLVFINPVGVGFSAAITPNKNRDFWGVDSDARCVKQFIKRYLAANNRWNSPKFLYGESYGSARMCVLSWLLHEDGVHTNGVALESACLDLANAGLPIGLLPTLAANAWFHGKTGINPVPATLASLMDEVMTFAAGAYAAAIGYRTDELPGVIAKLSDYTGIPAVELIARKLNVAKREGDGSLAFLRSLRRADDLLLSAYDGRVTRVASGIASLVHSDTADNDPMMTAINGAYVAIWHSYLGNELKFVPTSSFTIMNFQAADAWDFSHRDPTGAETGKDGKGNVILYTGGDLAAAMSHNPALKVLSLNGYYDSVTPFFQTVLDLRDLPIENPVIRGNLTVRHYPSGHLVYLDGTSRAAMKADLIAFYGATGPPAGCMRFV